MQPARELALRCAPRPDRGGAPPRGTQGAPALLLRRAALATRPELSTRCSPRPRAPASGSAAPAAPTPVYLRARDRASTAGRTPPLVRAPGPRRFPPHAGGAATRRRLAALRTRVGGPSPSPARPGARRIPRALQP